MYKRYLLLPVLVFLGYGLVTSNDFKTIAAGIAIFIVGMLFMEDGFKLFTGGFLEKILRKTTQTTPKAIASGFLATALVQSSSLISVIAISFLSAELLALPQAIGIIFGSNIGTTATAWIVAAFGVKIKIAHYAMVMLVFGVLFTFFKKRSYKGFGKILLGLGFIFLGISFMKEGFETLRSGIDLGQYALSGVLGIAIYVVIGAAATVIIQSSSATMALIITAVASGQIEYINSISLAIGANVGTTVTAILGALTSNDNGKRLAVAHLIFNVITALFAIIFLYPLIHLVDNISGYVGIGDHDIAMKLSLFHTIFNFAGVLLVSPFIGVLVSILEKLFLQKGERRGKPIYLDEEVIRSPESAIVAIFKETEHLYDSISHTIVTALHLSKGDVFSQKELREVVTVVKGEEVDMDKIYLERIKSLYSAIIGYATMAERDMINHDRRKVYKLKLVSRNLINVIKDIREIEKNINRYMKGSNTYLRDEYNFMRENISSVLRDIEYLRKNRHDTNCIEKLEQEIDRYKKFDILETKRLSILLHERKINDDMATSLMNDGVFTASIIKRLLRSAVILWSDGGVMEMNEVKITLQESLTIDLDESANIR